MNEMNEIHDINEVEINEPLDESDDVEITEAPCEAPEAEEATADTSPELFYVKHVKKLQDEIDKLRLELSTTRAAYERLSGECEEFTELYPNLPVTALPDSVWSSFKSGIPLAAAYALYEKKEAVAREKALNVNAKNKKLSSGSLYSKNNDEYFTPAEVRAMSASEVKANYAKIITSMSKWH